VAEPRPVEPNEIEDLAELIGTIFRLDDHYSRAYMVSQLKRPLARRDALVVCEDGKTVSHIRAAYSTVSVYGCEFKVASIGCVGTVEAYRGRGYAGAILETSLRQMEKKGAKVLIVSGSRGLYRRAHCVQAGRTLTATVRPGDLGESPSGISVRRVGPEDWPLLAPLQQAESVRFARPLGFLSTRPFWWDCDFPELWLVEREGVPVAYVGMTRERRDDQGVRSRHMWEYAGARAGLLAGLSAISRESGVQKIHLKVLGHDRETEYLLGRRGVALKEGTLGGTHRLIDLPGLMRKLRPYLRERLESRDVRMLSFDQAGDRCVFAYGEERLECGIGEATALVLGGSAAPDVSGDLGRVLSRVLPVPFPTPGFDYI